MTPFWDDRVAGWVADQIWGDRAFGECQAMGVEHGGRIVGGVVFHDWTPDAQTIEVSAAATDRRWMTRAVVREAMGYVFDVVGCQMLVARQDIANRPARKVWLSLGGSEIVIPRLYGRDRDGTVITLTAEQWRGSKFNKEACHGQRLSTETA